MLWAHLFVRGLLIAERTSRAPRSPVCENVSRKNQNSSFRYNVTWRRWRDKAAARYTLKCMAKHSRDYGVGITHSHVRFIWIRHLARGHILYTHLSGPAWIARFSAKFCGRTLAITSAFHDTLQRRWVPWSPLHHVSPDLTMTYEPLFHGSTCRFAEKLFANIKGERDSHPGWSRIFADCFSH